MKARYFTLALCFALVLFAAGCGKKAEESATAPAATAPAAAPIDPATAATVTGTVKVDGTVAKGRPLMMTAEPTCHKEHGSKAVPNPEVEVGADGSLANVLVYVKDGLGNRAFDVPKEPVTIDQKGCMYLPRVVNLQTNQTLHVTNSDPVTHNIHPAPSINRGWNKSQPAGAVPLDEKFAREEVIPVKCDVHPWMRSYIAVFKHPYHSVTGATGAFELKNLPPGEYTIEAWHEKLGTATEKVTLGAKESKAITFTFKATSGD